MVCILPSFTILSSTSACKLHASWCFRVEDRFKYRDYYLVDESLTWEQARARCSQNSDGYLAVAYSVEHFNFLKGMFDNYRSQGGSAAGAWINGKYTSSVSKWFCYDYTYGYGPTCLAGMPWSNGEPGSLATEHCIRVAQTNTDGVVNGQCDDTMPAICAKFRYVFSRKLSQ